jgi:lycopene beta-cyclase
MPVDSGGARHFDLALVGGGLQNALICLAALHHLPERRILLVERETRLGGNHTWSFHTAVVAEQDWAFVEPLIAARWPRHRVIFPEHERDLGQAYASILSDRLDEVLRERLADHPQCELLEGVAADEIGAHQIRLADGRRFSADLVVDARGPEHLQANGAAGYQKFLGLELRLEQPSPISAPWLMDVRVPQIDGFRFVYVLPFSERRVLVEDTYYSDSPKLNRDRLREGIFAYCRKHGLVSADVEREEAGVLPIPIDRVAATSSQGPLIAGYQGGWFHATTGYSFPIALRLARHIATREPGAVFDADYQRLVREHQRQTRFCLLLNRMMFRAFLPEDRYRPLSRFYRLPEATILRFYGLTTTALDRARVVVGRPPRGFSLTRLVSGGAG